MKYLLTILIFSLFSSVIFGQDTTKTVIKPQTKRDYEFGRKPTPKPRPKPEFGWNAALINLDDLYRHRKEIVYFI